LHHPDQRFTGEFALQAAKLLRRNDAILITTMHSHVLSPLAAHPANDSGQTFNLRERVNEDVMNVLLLLVAFALHIVSQLDRDCPVDRRTAQKAAHFHAGNDALFGAVEPHPIGRSTGCASALGGAADSNSSTQATKAGAITVTMEKPTAVAL
jgi:hypothetical protein